MHILYCLYQFDINEQAQYAKIKRRAGNRGRGQGAGPDAARAAALEAGQGEAGAPEEREGQGMKLKKVAAICNAGGRYCLMDQKDENGEIVSQWLGDWGDRKSTRLNSSHAT